MKLAPARPAPAGAMTSKPRPTARNTTKFSAGRGPGPRPVRLGPRPESPLERPTIDPPRADRPAAVRHEPPPADPAEPLSRALALPPALLAPVLAPPLPAMTPTREWTPSEVALESLVRRFAWGGNGRRGTARIELGAGSLAGLTLLLSAEDGEIVLSVEGDPSGEHGRRLAERLSARGLKVTSVA